MLETPTVTIEHPDHSGQPMIINKSDYDPKAHKLYVPPKEKTDGKAGAGKGAGKAAAASAESEADPEAEGSEEEEAPAAPPKTRSRKKTEPEG